MRTLSDHTTIDDNDVHEVESLYALLLALGRVKQYKGVISIQLVGPVKVVVDGVEYRVLNDFDQMTDSRYSVIELGLDSTDLYDRLQRWQIRWLGYERVYNFEKWPNRFTRDEGASLNRAADLLSRGRSLSYLEDLLLQPHIRGVRLRLDELVELDDGSRRMTIFYRSMLKGENMPVGYFVKKKRKGWRLMPLRK